MPILPLIGSIYQAQTNQEIANDANATSIALMREQNRFNAEEAAKSREWMSYDNQRKLMEKAGLNPALMFGQGQLSAAATQATASGIPSIQSYPINNPFGSSSLSEISSAMKNLAEAKKAGADTEAVMKLLDKQALALDLQNEYQSILNTYQGKKSATEIAKMIQDIERQYVEIDNLIKDGNLTEAQTRLTKVQEDIAEENKGLAHAERELKQALADKREEYTSNILNQQKEEINTTKKQGNMYTQQGNAAVMQGKAAIMQGEAAKSNAETNRRVGEQSISESISRQFKMRADIAFDLVDAVKKRAEIKGIRLSNENLEKLMPIIAQKAQLEYDQAHQDYWNPFRWILGSGGSFVDGVIKGAMLK